jgi:hypothetical protein
MRSTRKNQPNEVGGPAPREIPEKWVPTASAWLWPAPVKGNAEADQEQGAKRVPSKRLVDESHHRSLDEAHTGLGDWNQPRASLPQPTKRKAYCELRAAPGMALPQMRDRLITWPTSVGNGGAMADQRAKGRMQTGALRQQEQRQLSISIRQKQALRTNVCKGTVTQHLVKGRACRQMRNH